MNFEELLRKYIDHVGQCEGVTFLSSRWAGDSTVEFSDEEWAELQRLAFETE